MSAIEERIAGELERGAGPALVPEPRGARRRRIPTRERLLGQLVLALYRSGRQADALAAYRSGREALVEVLGLEPGPALRELELQILRHDPSLLAASAPVKPSHAAARRRALVAAAVVAVAAATRHRRDRRDRVRPLESCHSDPRQYAARARPQDQPDRREHSDRAGRCSPRLDDTTHSGSQANASAPCRGSIFAPHAVKTIGEPHPVAFIAHDDRGNIYASGWDFPFVWQINPRTVQIVRAYRVKRHSALELGRRRGLAVGGQSDGERSHAYRPCPAPGRRDDPGSESIRSPWRSATARSGSQTGTRAPCR